MKLMFWVVALTLLIAPMARADEAVAADVAWLHGAIADLDADDYFAREKASAALVEAGQAAIPLLVEAAAKPSLEATARAISILGELALSPDMATADAAEAALDGLAESADERVVSRAKTALRARLEHRRDQALARLRQLGANAQLQGNELSQLRISGGVWKGSDEDLQLLHWFPELWELNFEQVTLGDDALKFLEPRMELQRLKLDRARISEQGFAHVGRLTGLRWLQALDVPLNDGSMQTIVKLQQLELLNLSKNAITDAGLAQVATLKNLVSLRLERMPITDVALRSLEQLDTLKGLELKHLPITNAGLKHVESLPRLLVLQIKYCPIDESCLVKLGENANLGGLTLYGTLISLEAADAYAAAHPTVRFDHRAGGFLGVIGLKNPLGCQLQDVQAGMAAAEAGFEVGDLITHYDGKKVADFDALRAMIRTMQAGESVEIRAARQGKEFTKTVTLGEENS